MYSIEHGIPIIAPRWSQLKVGRLIRGDRDPRLYHNLFRASPPGYLTGTASWLQRLSRHRAIDEPEDLRVRPADVNAPGVTVFRGERDHFRQLAGWEQVLLHELRAMTRPNWLERADHAETAPIGIHVRRGDFVEPTSEADFVLRGGIRTPIQWFVECLMAIRAISGCSLPAIVVSDAPNRALSDLLHLEHVTRVETGSAIGDLLVLAKARLLVASGGSSFSAWAAFLGQMPAVAFPGQSLTWFKITPTRGQYIGAWDHRASVPSKLAEDILMAAGRDPSRVTR